MLHIFYKRYPYGTKEAFAEDELAVLAKRFEKIKVYNFAEDASVIRALPENCELTRLYDKKKVRKCKLSAALRMLTPGTLKETLYMRKCGYKVCLKNLRRIYMYYFYDGFASKKAFNIKPGDIVYSYWLGDVSFPVSKLKKSEPGITFVSRAHGFDMYAERGYNPFRREIIGVVDSLYCINSSGRDDVLAHYGDLISPERVKTAHLGVVCPKNALQRKFSGDKCVIVTCSNIIELKRLDILICALSKLETEVEWYHFGSGDLKNKIKALAEEKLSGKKNIKYEFMGQTPHDEVLRYLREEQVDLFVNCSDYEGIPVSVMEAMAYGIPCIARNVGGMSEVLNDKCGMLLDKDADSSAFCKAIVEYSHLSEREKKILSVNAFELINSQFNSGKNYSTFADDLKSKTR